MFSVLPVIILLSSLAEHRIDADLSRHLGLSAQGARVIRELFHHSARHPAGPIAIALVFGFAGTLAVAGSLRSLYERVFGLARGGWRGLPRLIVWVVVLIGALVAEAAVSGPVRSAVGPVVVLVIRFAAALAFFAWTIHFLLAGRVPWRRVTRPALTTAAAWLGLAGFSTLYISPAIVSDTRLYGIVGATFNLLTWFIAIGAVVVLGAVAGVAWDGRRLPG